MAEQELTPADIVSRIEEAFQPDQAAGLEATYQFDIGGPQGGQWYATIRESSCQLQEGVAPSPDTTFSISDENFVKLITGRLNGPMAFMTGKLKVKGDMAKAMRLSNLFKLPDQG